MTRPNGPAEFIACVALRQGACWEWQGYRVKGYGKFKHVGGQLAHRYAYTLLVGPIPDGLVIDHLCRNPGCVNPSHLEPVTNVENVMRGQGPTVINAAKTHCPKGHPYDEQNTLRIGNARRCRECNRAKCAQYGRARRGGLNDQERQAA